jgi:hypothetical protein
MLKTAGEEEPEIRTNTIGLNIKKSSSSVSAVYFIGVILISILYL